MVVRYGLDDAGLDQLLALYADAWWSRRRTRDDVARMLAATDLVVGLYDRRDERLAAFGRVLTDFTYTALVMDIIVAEPLRGTGLGRRLMDALLAHPRLESVQSIELVCQPDLMPFYEQWGFTGRVAGSRLMRKTRNPNLTG